MNKVQVEQQINNLMENGGKVVDKVDTKGNVVTKGTPTGLPYKTAKQIARQNLHKQANYVAGKLGSSEVAGKQSRRERREQARQNKVEFIKKYNGHVPQTHEEFYGVGYERFNSKFVKIK